MASLVAAVVMTLSVLGGHSPIASLLIKCDISYLWRICVPLHLQRLWKRKTYVAFQTALNHAKTAL